MKETGGSSHDTRRRFEQWANNPHCAANAASAILNIPMTAVVRAEGGLAKFGQSPFALARGKSFERAMFKDKAAVLRAELTACGVLSSASTGFADFRFTQNGGPCGKLDDALNGTIKWLKELTAGRINRAIAASATIRIPGGVMLPHATLCIDAIAVTVRNRKPTLIVGEIKVYPDRGGYTDNMQLATSRAQAGMYVHGLRLAIDAAKLSTKISVDSTGFLVLSKIGSNRISVRHNEDFSGQADRARAGLSMLSAVAQKLDLTPSTGLPVIQNAAVSYCEACVEFCERADICRARADAMGDGAVLGDEVQQFLGDVGLDRVRALAEGASPANQQEKEIATLLATAEATDERRT